jgi:hypothetical protein
MYRRGSRVYVRPLIWYLWSQACGGTRRLSHRPARQAAPASRLLLVLRDRSPLLAINGSALTVNVPMAASTLINAIGLPPELGRLLPSAMPVSVTILDNAALGRASTIVRLTDILSRILLPADVALALVGLAAARDRRRVLLAIVIPVAALGALGVRLLTRTAGSPLVTAATGVLTAPLTGQLLLTSAVCAALVALLLTVPRLLPHLGPDAGAPTPGNRGDSS